MVCVVVASSSSIIIRDINDELATFVSYHAYHKEKDQYVEFLESAKAFIAN